MATINLLPWREKCREVRKQQFIQIWMGALVLSGLIMVLVHGVFSYQIKTQLFINATLTNEITKLDLKIATVANIKAERDSLLSRMQVIQQLQFSRPLTVKVFDAVTRMMPKGIYLTQFSRVENQVVMQGKAESNSRVSELMRALAQSRYFSAPQLTEIKTDKADKVYKSDFELHCLQQNIRETKHG